MASLTALARLSRPYPILGTDPGNFVSRSIELASQPSAAGWASEMLSSIDPPLRYLGPAVWMRVGSLAGIGPIEAMNLYVAGFESIIAPLSIYIVGWTVWGRRAGQLAAIALFVATAIPGLTPGEHYQYLFAYPMAWLTIAAAVVAYRSDKSNFLASGVGVALGVVAMHQTTIAVESALLIGLYFLFQQSYRQFIATAVSGAVVSTPLVFAARYLRRAESNGAIATPSTVSVVGIEGTLTTPVVWLSLTLGIVAFYLTFYHGVTSPLLASMGVIVVFFGSILATFGGPTRYWTVRLGEFAVPILIPSLAVGFSELTTTLSAFSGRRLIQ